MLTSSLWIFKPKFEEVIPPPFITTPPVDPPSIVKGFVIIGRSNEGEIALTPEKVMISAAVVALDSSIAALSVQPQQPESQIPSPGLLSPASLALSTIKVAMKSSEKDGSVLSQDEALQSTNKVLSVLKLRE